MSRLRLLAPLLAALLVGAGSGTAGAQTTTVPGEITFERWTSGMTFMLAVRFRVCSPPAPKKPGAISGSRTTPGIGLLRKWTLRRRWSWR